MFGNNRQELRKFYFNAWHKHQNNLPLETVEQQIISVILEHPEYHSMFNKPDKYIDQEYLPEFGETNPFLHLGLHLGIRDQVATERPVGIRKIYQNLLQANSGDTLKTEHSMIDVLAETLWEMQKHGKTFDEQGYLEKLHLLMK